MDYTDKTKALFQSFKTPKEYDFMGYESPITEFHTAMQMQYEDGVLKAVQNVGFHVNKEELLKALQYDRDQYEKGYKDGLNADKWIPCSVRLPEVPEFSWKGYLVQCEDVREPYTAFWNGEKWEDAHGEEETGIIAWQPLPEPYKGRCE